MILKIISDGTSEGTHLINSETGEEVRYVQSISWSIDANTKEVKATIDLVKVPADIMNLLVNNIKVEKNENL